MQKVLLVLVLLAGTVGALYFIDYEPGSGISLRDTNSAQRAAANLTSDQAVLETLEARVTRVYADSYGIARVAGEVINNSDQDCALTVLSLAISDRQGTLLKKAEVDVRDIPAGHVRSFDVEIGIYKGAFGAEPQIVGASF